MAVYDLEEQERVDDLKAWWARWGNVASWIAIGIAAVIVAVQGWRYWQANRAEAASALYFAVATAGRTGDAAKAKEAMATLADQYAGTAYAPRAALLYAKQLWSDGDKAGAKAQLNWTIENASEDELKAIARFRLAEIQLDDKQYDDALKTLDAKVPASFKGLFADLRGDALVAAGRAAEARGAYQEAMGALDPKSPYRMYVQVKLDTVGGPSAAPSSATSGSKASAAPAAATAAPAPASATPAAPAPATPAK